MLEHFPWVPKQRVRERRVVLHEAHKIDLHRLVLLALGAGGGPVCGVDRFGNLILHPRIVRKSLLKAVDERRGQHPSELNRPQL